MKELENGESEKMTNLNSYIRKRPLQYWQTMHGRIKKLGFKLFKIACHRERDPWGRPWKIKEDQVKCDVDKTVDLVKNGRS